MICFPLEQKPDWRRPPFATILLIIINVCCFLFWQLDDNAETVAAVEYYFESELPEIELPAYEKYILQHENDKTINYVDRVKTEEDKDSYKVFLFQMIMNNLKKEGFSQKFREQFRGQYYRGYAKKYRDRNERGQTLNFTNGSTCSVEWRSFNLLPVQTWDEFERILKVAVETITQFISRVKEKNFNYSTRVSYKTDKKEILILDKLDMILPRRQRFDDELNEAMEQEPEDYPEQ